MGSKVLHGQELSDDLSGKPPGVSLSAISQPFKVCRKQMPVYAQDIHCQ